MVIVCALLLAAGCAPVEKKTTKTGIERKVATPTVRLALKFTPQESTTYRVLTERERAIDLQGPLTKDNTLKGGRTGSKTEITFTQQIQSVDEKGNAVAKITIKELKYSAKVKDKAIADFDSTREKNQRSPLAKLIGQSYTIRISPAGRVINIIDVKQAQTAVRSKSPANNPALAMLKPDAIKERHTIAALPGAGKNQVHIADKWSSVKTFDFGLMGAAAYERIYTLKGIKETTGHRLAVIDMNAIPSSEEAEKLYKEQETSIFSKMADNTQTYTGQLKLDLTAGVVEKYSEKLQTVWVIVDPSIKPGEHKQPAALKMKAIRLYSLKKID